MARRRYSKKEREAMEAFRDQYEAQRSEQSTAFKEAPKPGHTEKTDVLFNRPGDADKHGHVVRTTEPVDEAGNVRYYHVRDEDGNVYIDDKGDE